MMESFSINILRKSLSLLIFIAIFFTLFSSVSAGNWQNIGGDLQHSGYSDSPVVPLDLIWKYKVGVSDISAPIVDNGILFVGSDDNNLYAIDAATGKPKWEYSALGKVYTPTAKDGLVFAASFDNYLYALDSNGKLIWKKSTGSSVASPPMAYNDILYGGFDKYIYAIYIINGTIKWRYSTNGWVESAPAISQGTIYAGSDDNKIYALDLNKNPRWIYTTGGSISSSPSVVNGIVYAGSGDNSVYAIDSIDGTLKWSKKTNDRVKSSPVVYGKKVFAGSNDNAVYAFDIDKGDSIWKYQTNGRVESSPIVVRGALYAGSGDGKIYAIDTESGKPIDEYQAGAGIISLAISDNMLYATAKDGYVYAFGAKISQQPTILSTVSRDMVLPVLKINPIPANVTSPNLTISGTAQDPGGILVVTVNGIDAGADNWMTTLTLSNGTNSIIIVAVDKAGNIKTEVRKVVYTPVPIIKETEGKTPGFSFYFSLISFTVIVFFKKIQDNSRMKS